MDTETLAVGISVLVLALQFYQVKRYVKLESEVKRVTTELDQTLNRLYRALELTREVYLCQIRRFRFFEPLLSVIENDPQRKQNPQTFWKDHAKYEHTSAEAENFAKLNGYMIELQATANVIGNSELKQLVERVNAWIVNPQAHSQVPLGELHTLIREIQERIYSLIEQRLSA